MNKFKLVAQQETKQLGQTSQEIEDYVFFNSGGANMRQVMFNVNKKKILFISTRPLREKRFMKKKMSAINQTKHMKTY